MGQQQSKDELLYHKVTQGNIEAIKALRNSGANLEWVDREGKTPLIVACMNLNGLNIAQALLELGANVNAYRPGYHAGTALHHAAKRGLNDTVQLLLSYGANPLIKNDACQTPLEVARAKGFSNVVRAIERRICIFSGRMKELYGPGFLEALAPQFLSRKIWVVVIPCGLADPAKPLKLELAIYSSLEDARPRNVIALWKAKANVEDIRFYQSVPVLTVFDTSNKTRYKLTSVRDSEHKQLQLLHKACIGAIEATTQNTNTTTTVPQSFAETSQEAMGLLSGTNSSMNSPIGKKILHRHRQSSRIKDTNDWSNNTDDSAHDGWGTLVRAQPTSETNIHGWMDDQAKFQGDDGWGSTEDVSSERRHAVQGQGSTSTEVRCNGWDNEPATEEYNGWAVPEPKNRCRDASAEVDYQGWGNTAKDSVLPSISKIASSGVNSREAMGETDNALEYWPTMDPFENTEAQEGNLAFGFASPSAPPVPEEVVDEEAIHYPTVDLSPVYLPNPPVGQAATLTTKTKDADEPALCIICWEASVEGACVPCGHMAGCMQCLNQIKLKKGECPVCRVKIDQVIKLYSVSCERTTQ